MDSFYMTQGGELYYYKLREKRGIDTIFVSKLVEFENSITKVKKSRREIRKVFGNEEVSEIVQVKGELLLRCSPAGRKQVKVIVFDNNNNQLGLVIQNFRGDKGSPDTETSFSFYENEFNELLEFLELVGFIDLSNTNNFQISLQELRKKATTDIEDQKFLNSLRDLKGEDRLKLLEQIKNECLTKEDLDILSGRKDGLKKFHKSLYDSKEWKESDWQDFFEKNTWIFGYGLDYRFLKILQREAFTSNSDIDGKNTVKSDYLMGNNDFTVLVEIKRPDTPLFENTQNRSKSWKLSNQLIDAVSQILAQKAHWEVKALIPSYNSKGEIISQKTCDPKCILIIGTKDQFSGSEREKDIKYRTFELFRRDSRNIEILTYDELYDRANYIVNHKV